MKFRAAIMYLFSVILCIGAVVFCAVSYIKFKAAPLTVPKTATPVSESAKAASEPEKTEKSTTKSTSSTEKKAVAAAASGQATTKIKAVTLTHSNANLYYNNVHIKNNTGVKIDLKSLLTAKLKFKINKGNTPQILIMHTHTTECFLNEDRNYCTSSDKSRTTDNSKNVVAVGNVLANVLKKSGYAVIHDTSVHDYPSYSGSYSRSANTVIKNLSKYKNIKIVIDLHRDAFGGDERIKPIAKINGKTAAQVMLVMGSNTGTVKNHKNWQENLKLATKFQQTMEVMYPTLVRTMSVNSAKYNQNLSSGSILLEVGTEVNTLEQAKYSATLVGNALVSLLNTIK